MDTEQIPEWVKQDRACRMMWVRIQAHIWRARAIVVHEDDKEAIQRLVRLAHYQCDHQIREDVL